MRFEECFSIYIYAAFNFRSIMIFPSLAMATSFLSASRSPRPLWRHSPSLTSLVTATSVLCASWNTFSSPSPLLHRHPPGAPRGVHLWLPLHRPCVPRGIYFRHTLPCVALLITCALRGVHRLCISTPPSFKEYIVGILFPVLSPHLRRRHLLEHRVQSVFSRVTCDQSISCS